MQHTRVDHRCPDVLVAEQLLDRANVVPVLQEMRRERVPQRVAACPLLDPGLPQRGPHSPLDSLFVQVMPSSHAGSRVGRQARRREHPLPTPLRRRRRVLPRQRRRELDSGDTVPPVQVEDLPRLFELPAQRWPEAFRQDGVAVFASLAITNQQLSVLKIEVLDAQAKRLTQPSSPPVISWTHPPVLVGHSGKEVHGRW